MRKFCSAKWKAPQQPTPIFRLLQAAGGRLSAHYLDDRVDFETHDDLAQIAERLSEPLGQANEAVFCDRANVDAIGMFVVASVVFRVLRYELLRIVIFARQHVHYVLEQAARILLFDEEKVDARRHRFDVCALKRFRSRCPAAAALVNLRQHLLLEKHLLQFEQRLLMITFLAHLDARAPIVFRLYAVAFFTYLQTQIFAQNESNERADLRSDHKLDCERLLKNRVCKNLFF